MLYGELLIDWDVVGEVVEFAMDWWDDVVSIYEK